MKRVLITGANSYIGISFEKWIKENRKEIIVDTLDMLEPSWEDYDFSQYDSIFHVAGIAHADIGHVSEEQKSMYYKINCDLAEKTAKKAKVEGVKQFIYMSSIIVYGESAPIGKKKVITSDTKPSPNNFYGDSKLRAEEKLNQLNSELFKIVILRPPMIYGKGSKGNYPLLSKMSRLLPIFPRISNVRSLLYVENLCMFVALMIEYEEAGTFYPQNKEYAATYQIVSEIARTRKKRIWVTGIFNWVVIIMGKLPGKIGELVQKAFGSIVYEKELSNYPGDYAMFDLKESIKRTEGD